MNVFRGLGNTLLHEAATGDIPSMKAMPVFSRLILFVPTGKHGALGSTVARRLGRWESGNYTGLMEDVRRYEEASRNAVSAICRRLSASGEPSPLPPGS